VLLTDLCNLFQQRLIGRVRTRFPLFRCRFQQPVTAAAADPEGPADGADAVAVVSEIDDPFF